jgi:NAD(P)-dependent dehydrogenase (short-subunit alcohol dehydrogenase family)
VRELRGKTAVVTGAGSGIGRALARRWAKAGMRVVLADVDDRTVTEASEEMFAAGAEVLAVHCDVSVLEDVEALRDRALERFGQVNVVCNNAGVGSHAALIATTPIEDWRWTVGVNLWGVVHGVHAFLPPSPKSRRRSHRQHRLGGRDGRLSGHGRVQRHQVCRRRLVGDPLQGIGDDALDGRRVRAVP